MQIDVYSAARPIEPLHGVPDAMYVVAREDTRSRASRFRLDVAVLCNPYDDLRTSESAPSPRLRDFMRGRAGGTELAARRAALACLLLDAARSRLHMDCRVDPANGAHARASFVEGSSFAQQAVLRARHDPALRSEVDAAVRVGEREAAGIPGQTALDLGVPWHLRPGLEPAPVGRNLPDRHHPEQIFEGTNGVATEGQRGLYARFTYDF